MAKPAHVRVTFEGVVGTVGAPLEHWAFGVNFPADAIPLDGNDTVDDLIAEDCKNRYAAAWTAFMSTDVILTGVKVARIGADGKVAKRADGSFVQGVWTGSHPGTGGVKTYPLQTALCVSLMTNRRGPTGRGRFFLPWGAWDIQGNTKKLSVAAGGTFADTAKSFLNGLATAMTFAPQVVSSKGYMTEVDAVRVGLAPDTMRSRRRDLLEEYVVRPLL